MQAILGILAYAIYGSMALVAVYGVFCLILLVRKISQKRFSNVAADQFLDEVRDGLKGKDFEAVTEVCDSPPYWSKAVPQLILVAMEHRARPIKKLRQILAESFEREVLADLEYRMSWVNTIVKTAPMLGLLGTVTGMINAFAKISGSAATGGMNPAALADDISFALFTTAIGLAIAIPLVIGGSFITVRIGKLQDAVQQHLGVFLDDLETHVKTNRS
jgi:biopolymer transport protein ExbB/TolQ